MKIICIRSYICEIKKEIVFTNKKTYICAYPEDNHIIYIWILDNNNEWSFFTRKTFIKYFQNIDIHRNQKINELFQ